MHVCMYKTCQYIASYPNRVCTGMNFNSVWMTVFFCRTRFHTGSMFLPAGFTHELEHWSGDTDALHTREVCVCVCVCVCDGLTAPWNISERRNKDRFGD